MEKHFAELQRILCACLLLFSVFGTSTDAAESPHSDAIVSGVPWYDQHGNTVSARGACVVKDGDTFYLFGEFKSDEGNAFKGFSCYSSSDLCNWTFENIALPVQETGRLGPNTVGERPKVMRCPETGEYVMFMHTDDIQYKDPAVGYATCDTINGEYVFQGVLTYEGGPIRKWDMGVFQDDDAAGYLITHSGNLYRLSSDYKSVAEQVVKGMTEQCESPAIFKKEGLYYWLGSGLTGWERNDNYYFTASSLEGPWKERGVFAPEGSLTWNSQTTFVLPIVGSKETTYMFMGDRWAYPRQSSAATYVWQPLVFDGDTMLLPEYQQTWTVDTESGAWLPAAFKGKVLIHSNTKSIQYSENWNSHSSDGFSEHRSDSKGATCSIIFRGSRIALYCVARPDGGFGRVEIEDANGTVTVSSIFESYCAYPELSMRFLSPKLEPGDYKLTVTVIGEHFNWTTKSGKVWGSTGDFVSTEHIVVQDAE